MCERGTRSRRESEEKVEYRSAHSAKYFMYESWYRSLYLYRKPAKLVGSVTMLIEETKINEVEFIISGVPVSPSPYLEVRFSLYFLIYVQSTF